VCPGKDRKSFIEYWINSGKSYDGDYEQFADNFSRVFIGKSSLNRTPQISTRLSSDASNLTQIIGLIFENETKRSDFIEWLRILIPESTSISLHRRTRKRSPPPGHRIAGRFF
jgi:hypothetical protein